ncbi:MAG: ergothioneine biosynthesis protein EgtB [Gemmatimonadota bacterium]
MSRESLLRSYRMTRARSLELCRPLAPADYRVQSMTPVSPPWWNLGHTTWFFAKNVLEPCAEYTSRDSRLEFVLNSYYTALGPRISQANRGKVTRPTTREVLDFRSSVDERMEELIEACAPEAFERIRFLVATGLQHEQQHQELLLTEVKHIYWANPPELRPTYVEPAEPDAAEPDAAEPPKATWVTFEGGLLEFGNREGGWCWDNELPVHKAFLESFALANRLVTAGEFLEFVEDGGYREPLLWLSNGFATVEEEGWTGPLYWETDGGEWTIWTLSGQRALESDEPVCHVSFYEADAFARWKSRTYPEWEEARLPTEREWEEGARTAGFRPAAGNFAERGILHPRAAGGAGAPPESGRVARDGEAGLEPAVEAGPERRAGDTELEPEPEGATGLEPAGGPILLQAAGDVWEWTSNHYEAYPGFRPFPGSLQEYNGKFMDNQRVLRGGSCATPASHIRVSYRNFWAPETRFQFTGLRLARSLG